MSKKVSLVTASIIELSDGKFSLKIDRTLENGKRDISGFAAQFDTQEEAIERGTSEIKKFLTPVGYTEDEIDFEELPITYRHRWGSCVMGYHEECPEANSITIEEGIQSCQCECHEAVNA